MGIVSNVRPLGGERLALRSLTRCTTNGRPTERAAMDASQEIEEYPSDRGQVVPRPRGIRSRIPNGSKTLPDVDGRSTIARRYRDISSAIVADQGGIDACSESRLQLIRRFAAACLAEQGAPIASSGVLAAASGMPAKLRLARPQS